MYGYHGIAEPAKLAQFQIGLEPSHKWQRKSPRRERLSTELRAPRLSEFVLGTADSGHRWIVTDAVEWLYFAKIVADGWH